MNKHPNRGPAVNPALVGLIASAVMFGLLLFAFTNVTLFQSKIQINAEVSSADTLANGADVEVAGVKVGTVKNVTKGNQSGALVAMEINTQQATVYKDATAQIRPHGVFGPKFVQLVPGSQSAGGFPSGGTIDRANTSVSVDFEQVLNQFDDNTRQSLQTFFYEFGTWQENRGEDQGKVIDNLNVVTAQLTPPLQVIDNRQAQLGKFFDNNAVATETLADSPLDQIIHENNDVLTALDAHKAGLVNLVVHGNNVLNDIDQITAGNNVANLRALLPKLPTLLDALSRFSVDMGQGVNHLNPVIVPQYGQKDSDIGLAILRTRDAFGECDVSDTSGADTPHANQVKIVPCYGPDGKPWVEPGTGHVAHHHVKVLLGLHTNAAQPGTSEDEQRILCGPHTANATRGATPAFTCFTDPVQSAANSIPVAGEAPPAPFGASARVRPGAAGTGSVFAPLGPAGLLDILAGQ
ncbi:MAG: phospholipid/cholesterol/gamma-HCH transport system substrate-binding protein [Chloroflexota bacterium]|jgi:phospholipid/cholesterol/gamma-HCH transport system substrate-binding protein|nr:phospholipid/cholesterol/gamma-HCH transport system substrate-binding protein [Chloroflexota bacterium]